MLSRINVHAKGYSGNRIEITQTYVDMLNRGVTPVVCEKGSVGACGDLAPMSQMALSLMGEGECFFRGERMPARLALERAGIPVPGLQARDGLVANARGVLGLPQGGDATGPYPSVLLLHGLGSRARVRCRFARAAASHRRRYGVVWYSRSRSRKDCSTAARA